MRYGTLFPLATFSSVILCAVALAQQPPPQISCPPDQAPMHSVDAAGKSMSWCYHAGGQLFAHDAPIRGAIQYCEKDTDCRAGIFRCEHGICSRTNMGCKGDADCKYSEVCDVKGKCVSKGGHC